MSANFSEYAAIFGERSEDSRLGCPGTQTVPAVRTMPIRFVDKQERGHAERSSVAGAGGGRNGVEASRVISVDARTSDFHATGSFDSAPRRLRPPRRSAQDDLRFCQPVVLSTNRIGMVRTGQRPVCHDRRGRLSSSQLSPRHHGLLAKSRIATLNSQLF